MCPCRFKLLLCVSAWDCSSRTSLAQPGAQQDSNAARVRDEVDFGGSNQVIHFDSSLLEKAHRVCTSAGLSPAVCVQDVAGFAIDLCQANRAGTHAQRPTA